MYSAVTDLQNSEHGLLTSRFRRGLSDFFHSAGIMDECEVPAAPFRPGFAHGTQKPKTFSGSFLLFLLALFHQTENLIHR